MNNKISPDATPSLATKIYNMFTSNKVHVQQLKMAPKSDINNEKFDVRVRTQSSVICFHGVRSTHMLYECVEILFHENIYGVSMRDPIPFRKTLQINLCFKEKIMNKNFLDLKEYNIHNNDIVDLKVFPLRGGNLDYLTVIINGPLGSHVLQGVSDTTDLYTRVGELFDEVATTALRKSKYFNRNSFALYFAQHALSRRRILLSEYGIVDYATIEMRFHAIRGGYDLPLFQMNESYNVTLENWLLKNKNISNLKLQSMDTDFFSMDKTFLTFIKGHLNTLKLDKKICTTIEWLLENIEHIGQISHWYTKCESNVDFYRLTTLAYRLFANRSMSIDIWRNISKRFVTNVQADTGDFLKMLRRGLNTYNETINTDMYKKVSTVYTYLLVQGFLTKFGIELCEEDYTKMELVALKRNNNSAGMWFTVLDNTLFICEKLHAFSQTGDIDTFYHNETEYTNWFKESERVLALAPFTSNLSAHGTTYFSYISDINDLVEKGAAFAKYSKVLGAESIILKRRQASLMLLKNTEITRRASQKERKAPFGVLVHGTSSVGKSTFTKMLYYYYGSLHGLDKSDHFRYVRNPADEYWSNFDSSKWCIQMDDIAFLLPSKSSEVDPTLKEMLNVVNNVPYVPPQAALEDKGKTPVIAKLVIATTNASDLNAHEYFWCPLAVRRRLPFVVHVEPKKEYLHENGRFINPQSLPEVDGAFPNFWRITVQKLIPVFDGQRDRSTLETVKIFEDSMEFLRFYGEASKAHEKTQDKSELCDSTMSKLDVCPLCLNVVSMCECNLQSGFSEGILQIMWNWSINLLMCFFQFSWLIRLQIYIAKFRICRKFILYYIWSRFPRDLHVRLVGRLNGMSFQNKSWTIVLVCLSTVVAACRFYHVNIRKNDNKESKEVKENISTSFEVQGTVVSQPDSAKATELDLPKEETANVWYSSEIELTKFDLPLASQSLVNADSDRVRDLFSRNCVHLMIKKTKKCKGMKIGAVFVKGHLCMVNNHAFPEEDEDYEITIYQSKQLTGVNSNLVIKLKTRDIHRLPNCDMCMFEVLSIPPFKDITKFWTDSEIDITRSLTIRRKFDGEVEKCDMYNVRKYNRFPIEALKIERTVYLGKVSQATHVGDCGAINIAITPRGPVIIGLHTLGFETQCGVISVLRSDIEQLESLVKGDKSVHFQIDGSGAPNFESPDGPKTITVPHHKSVIRYLPSGTANIYGSFTGFRPKPKSSVTSTPLQAEMLEHFNCEVEHGKPVMSGWLPWHNSVKEMVNPNVTHDRAILDHCVESFTEEILTRLPIGWEKELLFLSRRASVNGLPSVKFIDKLKSTTSMGFPWACSKKKFLIDNPDDVYPDGLDFKPEVWERVEMIEKLYAEGKRAFPVFTGHLKDEATAFAKIESGKTRVFTGAPVDWSLVVRSRLLTFVRLLQKNKFIFEAGPGTVCQSSEWGNIYDYLTIYGRDRIVAGDYGKFDKRMISDFILSAFRIIASIHERAGFSKEEIREIMCIGEDTAFPVVNMNGDLIEFFGTNPSGHPLTVIINSIVNSLYMRYCFTMLNPKHECTHFKKDVNLFTYGDDNIMGVSEDAEWFNHTAIQTVLASIGVEYTMADKESESVPFIDIKDCSFLKRKWRWDYDVSAWLCPLEEKSIHKSLTMWVPSKSIDEFKQMIAVVTSANNEYFYYGKEIFQKHHNFFKELLCKEPYHLYVEEGTLPDWDTLLERFRRASENIEKDPMHV